MGRRGLLKKNPCNSLEAPVNINPVYNKNIHNFFLSVFVEIESTVQRCRNLPEVLRKKMSGVLMSEAKKKEGYSLGDLVHIRGKIKIFRGEREVVASYHSILCCNFKPYQMCTYKKKASPSYLGHHI